MNRSLRVEGEGGVVTKVEVKGSRTVIVHLEEPLEVTPNLDAPSNKYLLTLWRINAAKYSDHVLRMMGPDSIEDSRPSEEFDMSVDNGFKQLVENLISARIPKEILLKEASNLYLLSQNRNSPKSLAESMAATLVNHCFPED